MVSALARAALALLLALLPVPGLAQSDAPEASLELALDPAPEAPFLGEMILATLRGRYLGNVAREELVLPPMQGFSWMRLAPAEWSQTRVGTRPATLFELRLAFFPQAAGAQTLGPITHALTFAGPGAREDVAVTSPPVPIEIRPKPVTGDEGWIPARDVTLRDEWAPRPDRLGPDEWTVRTVTLTVDGQPPQALPEAPPMYAGGLFTFQDPEERSVELTPQGPISTVVWRYRMKPQTDAPADLDDIPISWYDTTARAGRSLLLDGRYIGFAATALPREPGPVARWGVAAGALGGALAGLALLAPRLGLRRSAAAGRLRRGIATLRQAARLALAERARDAAATRAALMALLHARGVDPAASPTLAALDRRLFSSVPWPAPRSLLRAAVAERR